MICTGAISGGLGDIIYAVPIMRALKIRRLYMKHRALEDGGNTFDAMVDIMTAQGFQCLPTDGNYDFQQYEPGLDFHYDLDQARRQPGRGNTHIIMSYMKQFNVWLEDWRAPWLENIININQYELLFPYNVVMVTPRWRENSHVNWANVITQSAATAPYNMFVGFYKDYVDFCIQWPSVAEKTKYIKTPNIYHMALLVQGAEAVYCNQNVCLTLAQGLGKKYYLDKKPFRTNTMMSTKNENIL